MAAWFSYVVGRGLLIFKVSQRGKGGPASNTNYLYRDNMMIREESLRLPSQGLFYIVRTYPFGVYYSTRVFPASTEAFCR